MDEKHFWVSLEYRLCREFIGLSERRYRYFWCDGFVPQYYILNEIPPRVTGYCWICNGSAQAQWDFTLILPRTFSSPEEINWIEIHPPENVTRWMAFDEKRKYIEIEPAVAVPDLK